MNEPFHLHIDYDGEERELPARFERWGYSHRFAVLIGETAYHFEPDEEDSYRVISEKTEYINAPVGLLKAIARKLATLQA
ncbi:hypothetical protein [uncultured Mucilaginibacter sp.]|uniref:hypothetical protein n=1 Tax=uncultured Mucilaginibacter sp. TaxID=797541 RepID=UPI0025F72B58|nr:hypothetical protein [uncultured Mucilaginibacter sp.]